MGMSALVAVIACGGDLSGDETSPKGESTANASNDAGTATPTTSTTDDASPPPDGFIDADAATRSVCFPSNDELDNSFRACVTKADCTSVTFEQDCCGTMRVTGVRLDKKDEAMACVSDRAKGFPACQCPSKGVFADDGTTSLFMGTTTLTCDAGRCETSFSEQ